MLVPKDDLATQEKLSDELHDMDAVTSIISYVDTVGTEIPESYLDADTLKKLMSDHYVRMVINVEEETEGEEAFALVKDIRACAEKYYPGEWYLVGEAGKGFAVVATEISGMATQTKEATVNITELIQNVSSAISEVVGEIRQMIAGINEEKQGASNTADSFLAIEKNTFAIQEHVKKLAAEINELKEANSVIVASIQTISAVSEEVSAHASETMEADEENSTRLNDMKDTMQGLLNKIEERRNR